MSDPKDEKLVSFDDELGEIDETAPGDATEGIDDTGDDVILAPEPPKK